MTDIIKSINNSDTLLDFLIQCEDFLDNMDIYAFQNWEEGEVVEGPIVSKYWVSFTLMYDHDQMPDPAGGLRLVSIGIKVEYKEIDWEDTELPTDPDHRINIDTLSSLSDGQAAQGTTLNRIVDYQPVEKYVKKWLVKITIPRQFIDDMNNINTDSFDTNVADTIEGEFGNGA